MNIKKKTINRLRWILDINNKNIESEMQKIALNKTAKYVLKNMYQTPSFKDKFELLRYSLKNVSLEGLFLEFGVYKGETINFISSIIKNEVIYGFDSFEGLPENWRTGFAKGYFKTNELPKVNSNVRLIKGLFITSIPKFLKKNNNDVAFLHVDSDLYSSAKTIFTLFANKIKSGTIIVFDEYFNYPGWESGGEYKAFQEFIKKNKLDYEYIGYVKFHE